MELTSVFQLLSSKDKTLLIGWNAFLILDLLLNVFDRIASLYLEGDGLAGECLQVWLTMSYKVYHVCYVCYANLNKDLHDEPLLVLKKVKSVNEIMNPNGVVTTNSLRLLANKRCVIRVRYRSFNSV
jgi:hypothetical protein